MSRQAPEHFVERLRAMDPRLEVLWHNWGDRRVVPGCWQRWRIAIKDRTGKLAHLFVVAEEDGSYRDLDERVLERLHRMDAHRFYDADQLLEWARENPSEEDREKIRAQQFLDSRFHDEIAALADQMAEIMGQNRNEAHQTRSLNEKAMSEHRRRSDRLAEVAAAEEAGRGVIVLDRDGLPRVAG